MGLHVQWSQKVSFRLETGQGFPQNDKNPKLFGTNLFLSLLFHFVVYLLDYSQAVLGQKLTF